MRASSSKAREEVDSCGTCRASFQPQIRRNCASRSRASSNCLVVPNPYTALATKALAIASAFVAKAVYGFGHKSTGDRQPVLRRATDPTSAAGDETRSEERRVGKEGRFVCPPYEQK